MANEIVNHDRWGGFTVETLNSMTYKDISVDNDGHNDNNVTQNIECTYIMPKQISHSCREVMKCTSVMNFNIRSMQTNFENFVAELVDSN